MIAASPRVPKDLTTILERHRGERPKDLTCSLGCYEAGLVGRV